MRVRLIRSIAIMSYGNNCLSIDALLIQGLFSLYCAEIVSLLCPAEAAVTYSSDATNVLKP